MRADPQGAAEMAPKGSSFSLGGGIPPVATYIKPTTIKHEIKLFMMIMIMINVLKSAIPLSIEYMRQGSTKVAKGYIVLSQQEITYNLNEMILHPKP